MCHRRSTQTTFMIVAAIVAVGSTWDGTLRCASADQDIEAYLDVERNIGVAFGLMPEGTDEVSVTLMAPDEWSIVVSDESSKVVDPSGTTIWKRITATSVAHYWRGYGFQTESGQADITNTIINSGASVRFWGELYKSGSGGETPEFLASVADIDIDVDSSQPPRHEADHWPPYAEESTDRGQAEDQSESTETGGLFLPTSLYEGEDFPSTCDDNYKILNVQIRTKYQGGLQRDDPCLTSAGTLAFSISGLGIALYDSQSQRVTGPIDVPLSGMEEQYRILTNDLFTTSGGITAAFNWKTDPDSYGLVVASGSRTIARDYVRLAPLEVDLDIDSDNNNGFDEPARTDHEDEIENEEGDPDKPGKILLVNDNDDDCDGVPDFADGFNKFGGTTNITERETFVPLVIELSDAIDPTTASLRITYDDSNPNDVTGTGTEADPYVPAGGHLRIWTKNGNVARNLNSVTDGGDYVPSMTYDDLIDLGFDATTGEVTLYVEAVRASSSVADLDIKVEVDPNPSESGSMEAVCEDIVRVTVIQMNVDIDTDSENDGDIDENDDRLIDHDGNPNTPQVPFEEQAPGKILAVGSGLRQPVVLKAEADGPSALNDVAYSLLFDNSTIALYDAETDGNSISPGAISDSTPITEAELLTGVTAYMEGVDVDATNIILMATNDFNVAVSDTVRVNVALDLDADSNNNGAVDFDDSEEDGMEDDSVGKRVFVNKDDDNKNGEPDSDDDHSDYTRPNPDVSDNDFAEIQLVFNLTQEELATLTGYKLYLIADPGLNVWADGLKTALADIDNPPGGSSGTEGAEADSTDDVYWWTIGTDTFGNQPRSFYVEGTQTGTRRVRWQLRNGDHILARDTIRISVEKMVWPFATQKYQSWQDRPTTDWVGLEVADAWYMDKALINYITAPGSKGILETIHPDMDDPTTPGIQLTWASKAGGLSTTTGSYSTGFTMEFDYSFERSRGDGINGYVRIDNNGAQPTKLSFVGNSGVKFGGKEVAILDEWAMVNRGGGLDEFDPSQGGYVQSDGIVDTDDDYVEEPLKRLMTGVIYAGDYAKMADNPNYPTAPPSSAGEYYATLENNEGRTNAHMNIDVTNVSGTTYTVNIYLDNDPNVCYSENVTLTAFSTLELQSHWGSGVIFSNMDISKK